VNTIQRLVAGVVLSAPIATIGCSAFTRNCVPLIEIRDRLPGGTIFDENHNNILETRELEKYFRVMLNKSVGENFTKHDLEEMRKVAPRLRLHHHSYGDGGIPSNIRETLKNLEVFIDTIERNIQNGQDDEIREKKNKMFPPIKDGVETRRKK